MFAAIDSNKSIKNLLNYGEKTLTRLTYPNKEENRQAYLRREAATVSSEAGQILHLKRLLVTLKQHYEKSLHHLQTQLQAEHSQRLASQKELENGQIQWAEIQKHHEEEVHSLRNQQITLKELLKKAQDELNQLRPQSASQSDCETSRQRVEQLELVIPYLRDQTAEASLETEQLREQLNEALKKVKTLEQDLTKNQQNAHWKIEHLQQLLDEQKQQEQELETVVSTTSSHHLRRELEGIKRTLVQGSQEAKALEERYVEILNEKIGLEHQCKQLQQQLEHQSSNLTSFQEQLHEIQDHKKTLEVALQAKEREENDSYQQRQELGKHIEDLNKRIKEQEFIQDKYEQLKEEWKQLSERLEEAIEMRAQTEQHLIQLETIAANQESQLQEFAQQLQILNQEKGILEAERDQIKSLLGESETRLKVAQQHLAKKVKEAALLSEKLEEQQISLTDFAQTIEYQKTQLAQLQAGQDLYQRQEKRLQEQLHEALKGTESQIVKWEEKYFRMYDKWQESENRIRELKKFEEKHLQMQSLLANLGNFMGGALNPSNVVFQAGQEIAERSVQPFSLETPLTEQPSSVNTQTEPEAEKYDVFGMRQSPDKYNPHLFT